MLRGPHPSLVLHPLGPALLLWRVEEVGEGSEGASWVERQGCW